MLQILNGRSQIAAAHAELDGDITAAILAIDHKGAVAGLYISDLANGHSASVSRWQQDALNGVRTIAISLRKTHSQIEPAVPLNDLGNGCATHRRLNRGIHVSSGETITRSLRAIDTDQQAGLATNTKDAHIGNALYGLHHPRNLVSQARQGFKIVAKQLERIFPLDPGHRLLNVVLDILRKIQVHARYVG